MTHLPRLSTAALAAAMLWSASLHEASAQSPPSRRIALVGGDVQVDPTAEAIRDGVVLVAGGRIVAVGDRESVAIPEDAETIDCSGSTVLAGFWNSHVHFSKRMWSSAQNIPSAELEEQLRRMLTRWGVTHAFDTGSVWENTRHIRDRIESGEITGPRIRSTGSMVGPPGSATPALLLDALGFMHGGWIEVEDPPSALAAAKEVLDTGVDGLKLYAALWFPPRTALSEDAIRVATDEAHRRGKLVFAHPTSREGLLASVSGGVDVLVHTTPQSGPWDDSVIAAMKEANVALIPTLKLWAYELRNDRAPLRERFERAAVDQLRLWNAAGGVVLFGTDVGYMEDHDPTDEYALLDRAGMSFRRILAALTTAPAERFGEAQHYGRIAPGFSADLTVVEGDPSVDVRALAAVRYTIRNGAVIYRSE